MPPRHGFGQERQKIRIFQRYPQLPVCTKSPTNLRDALFPIFIFDIHRTPAKPTLVCTISDFVARSDGVVGPYTFYALPGRMLISGLSNDETVAGRYQNENNHKTDASK